MKNRFKKTNSRVNGFSLIEVATAMVILGTVLAYAMPVILQSKLGNIKSEQRAGALMVSQRIFDDIRSKNFSALPDPTIETTEYYSSASANLADKEKAKALGRSYNVSVIYCKKSGTPAVSDCTNNYRSFTIIIRDPKGNQLSDNSIIYEVQAAFTDFKGVL
jgi:prepilin-type N-terminal cleavage/methylation domain-containing protein